MPIFVSYSSKSMKFFSIILFLSLILNGRVLSNKQPKLIVLLSYDQMRGDYIERFRPFLRSDGFLKLADSGFNYTNCHYSHASNVTCAGHAVLMTGCNPWKTGIVSNDFFDRETQCNCYCTEEASPLPNHKHILSPNLMLVNTLGDYIRNHHPSSKLFSIAIKDRAAILMAGKKASNVLWMNDSTGNFETSPHYNTPKWLDTWNSENPASQYFGKTWNAVLPYSRTVSDSVKEEGKMPGGTNYFPHKIPSHGENAVYAYACSPFAVSHLFNASKVAIERENLGKDTEPDVLCLGISTTDLTGHIFGPDSKEIQELYFHCDTIIANFIRYLDTKVGRDNYVLVVSSDHGVAPIPEVLQKLTPVPIDAGRISISKLKKELNSFLKNELKITSDKDPILALYPPAITFNMNLISDEKMYENAMTKSIDFLKNYKGIAFVIPTRNLLANENIENWDNEMFEKIRRSTNPLRSGDIVFYPKSYWIYGSNPASHGTPYSYDTHVPLIFFGNNVVSQRSDVTVSPADIAPTLGSILGIQMNNTDGKILSIKQ